MIAEEWPKVSADVDAGRPTPLGLVRIRSNDPSYMKENHQVLAYGYDLSGTVLTLRLYDPNHPRNDDVTLSLSVANPSARTVVRSSPAGPAVLAFFRVRYRRASPP
jgi:hypothetical protein